MSLLRFRAVGVGARLFNVIYQDDSYNSPSLYYHFTGQMGVDISPEDNKSKQFLVNEF